MSNLGNFQAKRAENLQSLGKIWKNFLKLRNFLKNWDFHFGNWEFIQKLSPKFCENWEIRKIAKGSTTRFWKKACYRTEGIVTHLNFGKNINVSTRWRQCRNWYFCKEQSFRNVLPSREYILNQSRQIFET